MPQQVEELSIAASISVLGVVALVEKQWEVRIVLTTIIRITEKALGNPTPAEAIVLDHTMSIPGSFPSPVRRQEITIPDKWKSQFRERESRCRFL